MVGVLFGVCSGDGCRWGGIRFRISNLENGMYQKRVFREPMGDGVEMNVVSAAR